MFDTSESDTAQKDPNQLPAYQYAADNHNYGNGNFAVTDPSTWGDGVVSAAKFVAVSAASGLNSFYNTGVTVSNWLGSDAEQNDIAVQLGDLDDDLGKYYTEHRQGADIAGFVLTSLIPGIGGVKILNAGQKALRVASETGVVGANLSRATGLLAPSVDAFRIRAAADITQSAATFNALGGNTLKAIGAGYGQAALESAAFEIAVQATSFKSPVLSDMDGSDIAKNILVGTLTGGVIGGVINHAITAGAISKAGRSLNPIEKAFTDTSDVVGLTPAQRIIARQEHMEALPEVPTAGDITSGRVPGADKLVAGLTGGEQESVAANISAKLGRLKDETTTSIQLKNRNDIHTLVTGKDAEVANTVADLVQGVSGAQMTNNFTHLQEIARIGTPMEAEKTITAFNKKQAATLTGILEGDAAVTSPPAKIGYLSLKGDSAGSMSFESPKLLNLADTLQNKQQVLDKIAGYKFAQTKAWSALNTTDHLEAEARYLWADAQPALQEGVAINEHDLPMLEKAVMEKVQTIHITPADGSGTYEISGATNIFSKLQDIKSEVAHKLQTTDGLTSPEIAKITNMNPNLLEGDIGINPQRNYLARQYQLADYEKSLTDTGIKGKELESRIADYAYKPSVAKVAYDTTQLQDVNGMQLSGMAYIKAQQKLYAQGVNNVIAAHVPDELYSQLIHSTDMVLLGANKFGAGPGLFKSANGSYGTLASDLESNGRVTSQLQKYFKNATSDTMQTHAYNIANNQEVAIGFESINKQLMSTSELYGINAEGTGLEPLKALDWKAAVTTGNKKEYPQLQEGAAKFIPIDDPKVLAAWNARTQLTSARTQAYADLRNAQGLEDLKDPRALRPIRPDPKDYPFYAVVSDPAITGVGHKSMIHAASASELDQMIAKVPDNLEVYKGDQLKQFFKANGDFDYEASLHENYIDSSLKSNGVNNPYFMRTDPQKIAQSLLQDHLRSDDIFARELMNAKFEKEFTFLRQQGEQYTSTATSTYTGSYRDIENTVANPYTNYIKTALNISQVSEHPLIMGLNTKLDQYVSKAYNTLTDAFAAAKTPAELDITNKLLDKFGVKSAYYDAATDLLANHSAPKGVLTKFVSTANSILATTILRLDPLNAINNVVGAGVLYGAETASVVKAIQRGDKDTVGALGALLETPVPGSAALAGKESQTITAPGKLLTNAIKNFTNPEATNSFGIPLKEFYKANGWSTRLADQFHDVMENLTLQGSEDVGVIQGKMNAAFAGAKVLAEKGEIYTGNKLAEEFNRFVAADTMRQISDIGVAKGLITPEEQIGYINTFVNRTQGNILASQRPLMFQGPIGQAVGLFQSFQFNTMQQLFRHVAEGAPKDAAMLLGLQGSIYGMNGLPAFNFLNTHIVGTASGNPQHQDLYSSTYGIAGKSVGDMLLYGLPSNMLRGNLYSRGDINPRQLTIIPTNPLDIPFVNATIKLYDDTRKTLSNVANGGSIWESMLQGIEHNGLSRPLAGIAQTLQAASHGGEVFSTTGKGSISGSNDLMSWATAVRVAGGKPLDDAIANDATYRISAYQATDRARMDALNSAIRTTTIGKGSFPSADETSRFAGEYAAIGGKQGAFNKYMMNQFKQSNTTQANKIINNLKSPYSQRMQEIMGGTQNLSGSEDE